MELNNAPEDSHIEYKPMKSSSEEEELNEPPEDFKFDPETQKILNYLNEVISFFKLNKLIFLKVSGGCLRKELTKAFNTEYNYSTASWF